MAEEIATVSIRQFAKDRGVSDTAIRKAINAGKIVEGRIFKNGIPCIIPEIATRELDLYEASPTRGEKKHTQPPAAKPVKPEQKKAQAPAPVAPPPTGEVPKPPAGSLAAARLIQAQLKAKTMEVELKQKLGELVNKKQVYEALFAFGQEVRSALQSLPDRHIDEILAAKSRNESHTILFNAISEALESLADSGKREITARNA